MATREHICLSFLQTCSVQLKLPYKKHSTPEKPSKSVIHPFNKGPEETTSVRHPTGHLLLSLACVPQLKEWEMKIHIALKWS